MILFYYVATTAMKALLTTLTRWQVEGKENVPKKGPLIVVANHLNLIDPPLLSASVPRRVTFMAKQELFRPSLGAYFVRAYGAFPVRRGELDKEALHQAFEVLRKGRVLGMFPEGKRSLSHQLQEAQPGSALIAVRSGASILPVGISGSEQVKGIGSIIHRPRITVTIGRPFSLPFDKDKPIRSQLPQLSELITERMAELLPPNYRGDHNFQNSLGSSNGN